MLSSPRFNGESFSTTSGANPGSTRAAASSYHRDPLSVVTREGKIPLRRFPGDLGPKQRPLTTTSSANPPPRTQAGAQSLTHDILERDVHNTNFPPGFTLSTAIVGLCRRRNERRGNGTRAFGARSTRTPVHSPLSQPVLYTVSRSLVCTFPISTYMYASAYKIC